MCLPLDVFVYFWQYAHNLQYINSQVTGFNIVNCRLVQYRLASAVILIIVLRYGTAQFKLDIYMCVALELFNKCVESLASFMLAPDGIL